MPVIRIDQDVYREIQLRVDQENVFRDTPNTVLRRLLKIDTNSLIPSGATLYDLIRTVVLSKGKRRSNALKTISDRFNAFGWTKEEHPNE
jgi:hypothetical protein